MKEKECLSHDMTVIGNGAVELNMKPKPKMGKGLISE